MSFFDKFFGYFLQPDGDYSWYSDNLRGGVFADWRHYTWLISFPVILTLIYRHYRKYPERGRRAVIVLSVILLIGRITLVTFPVLLGGLRPYGRILPFHLCAVIGFCLPLVIFFDAKRFAPAIYPIAIMGSITTLAFGMYFKSAFTPYYFYEGILSHSLLFIIPIIEIARGNFTLNIRESYKVVIGMLLLMVWSGLANRVFFVGHHTNYMYTERSGLPNGFGGSYYFLIYVALFILVFSCIYGFPAITRKFQTK